MQLISNKDYLLLIDEEAVIKEGYCIFKSTFGDGTVKTREQYYLAEWNDTISEYKGNEIPYIDRAQYGVNARNGIKGVYKIIAYRKLNREAKDLDLPLLPGFFIKNSIEEKVRSYIKDLKNMGWGDLQLVYQKGDFYRDGLIDSQSKQFSLEDMKRAIRIAKNSMGIDNDGETCYSNKPDDEIIQSLSTQGLPKEFIMEPVETNAPLQQYKTVRNSEGKQELVGEYKY